VILRDKISDLDIQHMMHFSSLKLLKVWDLIAAFGGKTAMMDGVNMHWRG
jgi:hypothetical protein